MKIRLKYNKVEPRTNSLNLMLEILDLSYSTWLSQFCWARKAVTPRAWYDKEVIFHPFVRLGKAWDELDNIGSGLKVISCPGFYVAFI